MIAGAVEVLQDRGLLFVALSPTIETAPLGPSRRRYANAAAVVDSVHPPDALLGLLGEVERAFGRRRRGQRWGARTLDLDIVLWDGGAWSSEALTLPHPRFRNRTFVLGPASAIAPNWRDPITGLTLAQLAARLTRPRPLPSAADGRALSSVGRATDF